MSFIFVCLCKTCSPELTDSFMYRACFSLCLLTLTNALSALQENAKRCPQCRIPIQRTEGCNKMVCVSCHCAFCYRCLRKNITYDHFGDGSCDLFDQEEIDAWERRMNPQRPLARQERQPR